MYFLIILKNSVQNILQICQFVGFYIAVSAYLCHILKAKYTDRLDAMEVSDGRCRRASGSALGGRSSDRIDTYLGKGYRAVGFQNCIGNGFA
jgi:hypothetical protein